MDDLRERLDTSEFLRYRLLKLLEQRDREKERGRNVDREFVESAIQLCRGLDAESRDA